MFLRRTGRSMPRRCAIYRQLQELKTLLPAMIRVYPYIKHQSIPKRSTMFNFIKALLPSLKSQRALDDAYLAQAADICDLEARMAAIEVRNLWTSRGALPA